MNTRTWLARQLALVLGPPLDALTLRRLSERDQRLAQAITSRNNESSPILAAIECHRVAMLGDHRLLVDGTLGPPGIYDRNQTIADACAVSKPPRAAYLLFALARVFAPKSVLELGTNVGISSAYIAAGLHGGRLTTLESSAYRLRLAKDMHQSIALDNIRYVQGLFADTLTTTLGAMPPVQMAFIDGHHQYQPTLDYFDSIWRHSEDNCIVVFDDIRWSPGMKRAWRELRYDSRTAVAADLWSVGVCITRQLGPAGSYRTFPMVSVLR